MKHPSPKSSKASKLTECLQYFQRYGYLPEAIAAKVSDEFQEDFVEALKGFQSFHGLERTGYLNPETISLIQTPRCGVGDMEPLIAAQRRWNHSDITYAIRNTPRNISLADTRTAVAAAFALWDACTPLRFRHVAPNKHHDIDIRFAAGDHGDGSAFDGPRGVLAHAFYPPPNGGDNAGDAHFDISETWTVTLPVPVNSFDLVTVAAHEFGHSIGLGHSNDRSGLMYPYYLGEHRHLGETDAKAATNLYADFGKIVFYEGNNATQDVVHVTSDKRGQNFRPRVNDEARSVKLTDVRA